jgi:hypothetical protein
MDKSKLPKKNPSGLLREQPKKVNTTDKRIKKQVNTSRGKRWRVVPNPNYKPPTPNKEKAKVKTKSEGDGGYYKIPGLKQPNFSGNGKKSKKVPSDRDKKIGQQVLQDIKEDDAAIAAGRNRQKQQQKKSEPKKSNVFTRHYKTGKPLGVMTRSERRRYDTEAKGRTFEGEVAKTGDKSNKRETNYKASLRKKKKKPAKDTNRAKLSLPEVRDTVYDKKYKGHDPNTGASNQRSSRRFGNRAKGS